MVKVSIVIERSGENRSAQQLNLSAQEYLSLKEQLNMIENNESNSEIDILDLLSSILSK